MFNFKLPPLLPQDGYVQVEVGNGSKRPVWMDGMKYSRAREVDFVSEGKKRIANTSIAPDTSTLEFEVDQLMQNNASGYWRCWEICIEQIENYDFNPREEEYCWEECEWVPVTLPSPSQPSPSPDPGDGSGGDDGGGGAGGVILMTTLMVVLAIRQVHPYLRKTKLLTINTKLR